MYYLPVNNGLDFDNAEVFAIKHRIATVKGIVWCTKLIKMQKKAPCICYKLFTLGMALDDKVNRPRPLPALSKLHLF